MLVDELVEKWNELKVKYHLKDWHLDIAPISSHYGRCYYYKKRIQISLYHLELNSDYHVLRTLLHEIAHAITMEGHTDTWRKFFEFLIRQELGVVEHIKGHGAHNQDRRLPTAAEKKDRLKFEIKL